MDWRTTRAVSSLCQGPTSAGDRRHPQDRKAQPLPGPDLWTQSCPTEPSGPGAAAHSPPGSSECSVCPCRLPTCGYPTVWLKTRGNQKGLSLSSLPTRSPGWRLCPWRPPWSAWSRVVAWRSSKQHLRGSAVSPADLMTRWHFLGHSRRGNLCPGTLCGGPGLSSPRCPARLGGSPCTPT